ncbi:hypothetical protein AB0F59_16745 [Micromonospora lupini]|uniref:hypothetical protein n=1 Tax=Micromonospora lupini TaxID=285679 RepID=UPI00340149C4
MLTYAQPPLATDERVVFTQRGYIPAGETALSVFGALLILTTERLLFAPVRIWGIGSFFEPWIRAKSMDLRNVTSVRPGPGARLTITSRFGDTVSFCAILPTGPGLVWQARKAVPYRDETVRQIRQASRVSGPGSSAADADGAASS